MRKSIVKAFLESSRAMQNVYICLVILALFLVRITFELYPFEIVLEDKVTYPFVEYFAGNLLPEISGMIIEVLLFLFVIDVLRDAEKIRYEQKIKESKHNRKVRIERRLRAQLRVLIRRMFQDVELSNGKTGEEFLFHAEDYVDNQQVFVELAARVSDEGEDSNFFDEVAKLASFELDILLSLAQLSANLSDNHMKAWMNIIYFLKQVSLGNKPLDNTKELLANIANFEKYSRSAYLDA